MLYTVYVQSVHVIQSMLGDAHYTEQRYGENIVTLHMIQPMLGAVHSVCTVWSSDFEIFLEIQYASCVFGLALKS